MNTPERSKVGTPTSKVEDSPVFSFINSLSPIQPVKSTHSAQAYHTLSFASISSVFTSPHANLQREARFPIRDSVSDLLKHEISSDNGGGNNPGAGTSNVVKPSLSARTCSLSEAAVDNSVEYSISSCDLPQPLPYDCHSPHHNATPCHPIKSELKSVLDHTPDELVEYDEDCLGKREILLATETDCQDEQTEAEVADHNWDDLISNDADNLMIFDSSTELQACGGPESDGSIVPPICEAKIAPRIEESEEVRDQDETGHRSQVFSENCETQALTSDRNQDMGHGSTSGISIACKVESQQQRGMRRRCLNFEGVPEMGLQNDPTACYSNGAHLSSNIPPVSFKAGNPLTCIVPGIGLHLNTLGLKDRFLNRETMVSGQRLISMPSPIGPFHSTTGHEPHDKPLSVDIAGSGIHNLKIMHDDISQSSSLISGKDLHQSSPKKKRRKSEIGAENREGCKRCNCKKSKCLKLYCECFAAGVFCAEPCSCQSCFNKPIHQETVLNTRKQIESRNPLAFAPKVIRPSDLDQEIGEEANKTPASARHKRGCNCKKSSCLKKYCECYQGGVGCSVSCRCEGCKNAFGRKDGSLLIEDEEFEQEEEQKDACLNVSDGLDAGEQSADPTNDELQYPESVLQLTPFQVIRPSMDMAILSSGQTPLSSSLTTVTSAGFNSSATLRRFERSLSDCKLGKHVRVDSEDETPAILKGNESPVSSVKATSPNQKRVSPPQFGTRLSPNRKRGRKLILKSIPSFPSLNNDSSYEISANYSDCSLDVPTQS